MSHRLIRALLHQPVDFTPIWVMRQAGRYLPEFKALRQKQPNFMSFCKNPELAVEATLQPLARFPLDAAIIFSDILVVPEAMGIELEIKPNIGPIIANPIQSLSDVDKLRIPEANEALGFVMSAIRQTVKELADKVPLIGFAGSPWTCATYMIEGKSSKSFDLVKKMLYRQPEILHALLEKLTTITIDYLQAQIDAGASVIMVFDTWGGILAYRDFPIFSLAYMKKIAENLVRNKSSDRVPLIFFTKGGGPWLNEIAASGCDAIGLDWTVNLSQVQKQLSRVALQGNMDPALLFASPERIQHEVETILNSISTSTGYVFNLGHGILPETPVEHMQVLVETVHNFSKKKNQKYGS